MRERLTCPKCGARVFETRRGNRKLPTHPQGQAFGVAAEPCPRSLTPLSEEDDRVLAEKVRTRKRQAIEGRLASLRVAEGQAMGEVELAQERLATVRSRLEEDKKAIKTLEEMSVAQLLALV